MTSLTKLLKRSFLDAYLGHAVAMLGQDIFLVVSEAAGVIASAGGVPEGFNPENGVSRTVVVRELFFDARPLGRLAVGYSGRNGDGGDVSRLQKAAAFLALSMESLMEREHVQRALGEETLEQYREVALMQRAVADLNGSMKLADVVRGLLTENQHGNQPADCGAVFIANPADGVPRCIGSFGGVTRSQYRKMPHSNLFHDVVDNRRPEIVNHLSQESRWSGEVPGLQSVLLVPLLASGQFLGVFVLGSTDREGGFAAVHLKRATMLATVAATALANAIHFEQIQHILSALIRSMATAIDARDSLTAGHSQRVASLALGLAQAVNMDDATCADLGFSDDELHEIFYAGLLHDVGKIGVREEVLTKASRLPRTHLELIGMRLALWGEITGTPRWQDEYARLEIINTAYDLSEDDVQVIDRLASLHLEVAGNAITVLSAEERIRLLTPRGNLTPEEWDEIKRHPAESYRILRNIPFTGHYPNLLSIVVQHHERLGGSGYPFGLKGDEIMLQSRIMAIVDIYDSLRRDRHYKKALSESMAVRILREEARLGMLDARLVEVFCTNLPTIESALHTDPLIQSSVNPVQ
ncbi:MAG: HD domain-containing phosphohydrolase [Desulfovibrionaceae bacterium]